ncbi:MAG: hypothetical protein E7287_00375 [Lachnospiraceae bacterium]|nr:hypothetical protein [Lachnospiraceae bacterium]
MSRRRERFADRFLAVLLSIMLLVAMLPRTILPVMAATDGHPDSFTVSVTDGTDAIDGVSVTLSAKEAEWSLNLNVITDENGVAAFDTDAIETALTTAGLDAGTIVYTATKTGYENATGEVGITVSNLALNADVIMTEIQAIPTLFTVSITDGTDPIDGVNVALSAKEAEWSLNLNVITDENGVAAFDTDAIETALTTASLDAGTIVYTATKTGYENATGEVEITVSNLALNADVIMTETQAIPTLFTVSVTDGTDPIDGVNVALSAKETEWSLNLNAPTDSNGVAKFDTADIETALTAADLDTGTIVYTATKAGYENATGEIEITVSNLSLSADVVMTETQYTLSVTVTGDAVVKLNDVEQNSITVAGQEEVAVVITPALGYYISSVSIGGVEQVVTDVTCFETDIVVNEDNEEVAVILAQYSYQVTASETENGSIGLSAAFVDYNGSSTVTVTPNTGYSIKSVKVNGVAVADFTETDNDGEITFTIDNITTHKTVTAEFVQTATCSLSDITSLFNNEAAVRKDGMTFIYANGGTITFSTDKTGIRIYNTEGQSVAGDGVTQTFNLTQSVTISKIQLRYKAGEELAENWHDVTGVSSEATLKLVIDASSTDSTITSDQKHSNNFYNNDFNVSITAKDENDYSGIKSIEYFVTDTAIEQNVNYADVSEESKTQSGVLYTYTDTITSEQTGTVTVDVEGNKNNSDYVSVWFKITDRAGNVEYKRTEYYLVNCTAPVLNSVTIDGNAHSEATAGYYSKRTATIVLTDRASSFNSDAATNGINIVAKDAEGNDVTISKPAMVQWSSAGNVHTATVVFETNAKYKWDISYVNKAGKALDKTSVVKTGDRIHEFTVDTKAPTGNISYSIEDTWNNLISTLTFGVWDKYSITATATADDEISEIYNILYYKSNADAALTETDLEELYQQGCFGTAVYTVSAEEKFVIYARITDYAGNTLYISTDGAIVDTTNSKITINPEQPNRNGFYNKDVTVNVVVSEMLENHDVYSGIKTIDYRVENDGVKTQEGNLYTFAVENPTYEQLKAEWTGSITVKAGVGEGQNNSDNVRVVITVVDNAGNEYSEETTLAINVDELSASIEMDGEAGKVVDGHGYFAMAERTATITLKDRASSFNADVATAGIVITAVDKEGKTVNNACRISDWTSVGDVHTATVTFKADAIYEWSFSYTNDADSILETITTGTSVTPYYFTVDNTLPTGTVTVNSSTWDKLINVLSFGLYSNIKAEVSATATDNISPFAVEYYKTSNPLAMTKAQLDNVTFEEYEDFSIETDEQFVVYLKITDYAGNYTYVSSNGYIVDKVASTITLTQSEEDALYNAASDVKVDVNVVATEPYSGIQSVDYWVECDGVKTQEQNLFTFNVKEPAQAELVAIWDGTISVDKTKNNSCDVVVYVKTVDNAGNESIASIDLDIDATAPSISVTFDNGNDNNGNTYFNAQRVATVVITERVHHFDAGAATAGIVINAVDAEGNVVENAYTISNWNTVENAEDPDASTHTAIITFSKDANYTWSIAYTDKAGNANVGVTTFATNGTSVAAFDFTVDTTSPTGTIKAVSAEGRQTEWNELRNELMFGFWSKASITLSGTCDDLTSALLQSVEYYKVKSASATDGTTALTAEQLDTVTSWTALTANVQSDDNGTYYSYDGLTVNSDEQFVVYVKLTDLAGNYTYISSNGLIVDHRAPIEEVIASEVILTPEQSASGIYNGNVNIAVKVTDPLINGTYSGISSITYKVFNMGVETQSGDLFVFNNASPKQSDLVQTWAGSIVVNGSLNNSNDVRVVVYAKDNSQNTSEKDVTIKIDTTAPVIDISYDNNVADNEKLFKENRTATVVVTERNFDPQAVNVTITNTDGVVPTIGGWTKIEGTGNQDNTKWMANIVYSADGDYTFDIAYTDMAGNACTSIAYGNSVAATEFTVDKTLPVISVAYDNNAEKNGNFFAAERTATITITEHNFDVNRVVFTQKASLDGKNITIPAVSWADNGDIHIATIVYSADGDYSFDITMTDMAGNESEEADYGNSVAGKVFVVDKTIDKPSVTGVENGKAYTGDVIPTISFDDVNYDSYEISLVRTRMGDKNVNVKEAFIGAITEQEQGGSGTFDTFKKVVENDGIYTLTVKMTDKAGNEAVEEVTFTVNRFGSVYVYSDYLVSLIKDGGQYITRAGENATAIAQDLVITEYNAGKLLNDSLSILITRDGKALDVDFDVNASGANAEASDSGWYEYVYTIKASNFAEDGAYKISLLSAYATADSESNESTSVPENSIDEKGNQILDTMNFMVDTTAPEIRNIINLDSSNGIVDEEKISDEGLKVSYTIVDVGGLKSVDILLNGKVHQTITEFGDSAFNYNGSFFIPEDTKTQTVQIVVTDIAGNVTDTSSEYFDTKGVYVFNNEVLVSRNFWVRFVNNPAMLWGTVGGTTAALGAVGYALTVRRKRRVK